MGTGRAHVWADIERLGGECGNIGHGMAYMWPKIGQPFFIKMFVKCYMFTSIIS